LYEAFKERAKISSSLMSFVNGN